MKKVLFLDVESDGLYGEPFAFGLVVGEISDKGEVSVQEKVGFRSDIEVKNSWVRENVLPHLNSLSVVPHEELFEKFYKLYKKYKDQGYELWVDVGYPVETNFLAKVFGSKEERMFEGPYPLYDLGNFLNPDVSRAEFSGKGYTHNPVDDAEASLYCLAKIRFNSL